LVRSRRADVDGGRYFGKNNIHLRHVHWHIYNTPDHFEIYSTLSSNDISNGSRAMPRAPRTGQRDLKTNCRSGAAHQFKTTASSSSRNARRVRPRRVGPCRTVPRRMLLPIERSARSPLWPDRTRATTYRVRHHSPVTHPPQRPLWVNEGLRTRERAGRRRSDDHRDAAVADIVPR